MTFDQAEFDVRCEWGENGVSQLALISDVVIIVDVLSFSTCVEIATNREAIISQLNGSLSPEARAELVAFRHAQTESGLLVKQCGSGKELIARGFEEDVVLASAVDVSACVPTLVNGTYVRAEG